MNTMPPSHQALLTFVNGLRSITPLANRIRSYARIIQDNPKGRSLPFAQLRALLALRDNQPGGILESFAPVAESGIFSDARLRYLLKIFREENEVLSPETAEGRGPMYMGKRYVIMHPDYYSPRIDYNDPEGGFYSLWMVGPSGDMNYSFAYTTNYVPMGERGLARFVVDVPYFVEEGRYSLEFRNGVGGVIPVGIAFNVAFKPYVIDLGEDDLFALRSGQRVNPDRTEDRESYLVVLSGKEFENAPGDSRSRLRGLVPGRADDPVLEDNRKGSGETANYFTDVELAQLVAFDKLNVLGIRGTEQSKPRLSLKAGVVVFDEEGEVLKIALPNGGERNDVTLEITTQRAVNTSADFGGILLERNPKNGLQYAAIIPQVSHIIEDFETKVTNANVYFLGRYSGKLSLRSVGVPDAVFGDTIQRAMIATGQVDTRIDRPLFVVFCKALVLAFDFLDLDSVPHLTRYLQVDDPYSSGNANTLATAITAAQNLQPNRDVYNPGVNKNGKPLDKGVRPASALAGDEAGQIGNAGGRRYGMFKIGNFRGTMANEILSIGHSVPRKGPEDGSGNTGKDGRLPFQTPVSLYPMLNSHYPPASFYAPQWSFKNDGKTPGRREKGGNETYLYRFFAEAFRKGAEKEGALQRLEFFNGKLLHAGTPPRSIDGYGFSKFYFPVSQGPYLNRLPLRTTFLRAEDGSDLQVIEGAIMLDLVRANFSHPVLLAWRRVSAPLEKERMVNYKRDFRLAAYVARGVYEGASEPRFELLDIDFGNEQPYLMDFNEADRSIMDNGLGVLGSAIALYAPIVQFNGDGCILTATVSADGKRALAYHLYTGMEENGEFKLRKKYADIALPGPEFSVVRVTNELETALPQETALENTYNSLHETVFVLLRDTGNQKALLLGRIGKGPNGGLMIVPADLTSDNYRSA